MTSDRGQKRVISPEFSREVRALFGDITQPNFGRLLGISPRAVWRHENEGARLPFGFAYSGLLRYHGFDKEATSILYLRPEIFLPPVLPGYTLPPYAEVQAMIARQQMESDEESHVA